MYKALIRPLLFLMNPEQAHHFTFAALKYLCLIPGVKSLLGLLFVKNEPSLKKHLLGLTFRNPVGLAAGLDKDARMIDEMACLGFGFIEIGTLTPRPQPGNDQPRLFRLPNDRALINRMGFNNEGVDRAVERLKKRKSQILVGGNIGKNKATPNELAAEDYVACMEVLYPYVDYFVVNVSSPNTPGLRELQEKESLMNLLNRVKDVSQRKENGRPVLLKIAPDLTNTQLDDVVDILKRTGTDGVIATNTTTSRDGLTTTPKVVSGMGAGGLSGSPLRKRATEVIGYLRQNLGPDYPIIGVGGIMSAEDAAEKIRAGADLIQVYTGFVYEGPALIKQINRRLVSG